MGGFKGQHLNVLEQSPLHLISLEDTRQRNKSRAAGVTGKREQGAPRSPSPHQPLVQQVSLHVHGSRATDRRAHGEVPAASVPGYGLPGSQVKHGSSGLPCGFQHGTYEGPQGPRQRLLPGPYQVKVTLAGASFARGPGQKKKEIPRRGNAVEHGWMENPGNSMGAEQGGMGQKRSLQG